MHLFCVSHQVRSGDEKSLTDALRSAATAFPRLGEGRLWSDTSASAKVIVAGLHHPGDMVGPRSYRARAGDVVVAFDGWPVHRSGSWNGHDAAALLAHWP